MQLPVLTKLPGSLEGHHGLSPHAPQAELTEGSRLSVLSPPSDSQGTFLRFAPKRRADVRVLVLRVSFGIQGKQNQSLHVEYIVRSQDGNPMQN